MHTTYQSPLAARYAGPAMQALFSEERKFKTWRRLWVALAQAQQALGLPISDEQIAELLRHQDDINYAEAEAREREVRHDVMAHIYAYGLQCPKAKPILHLGATSCYVGDNGDLIITRDALGLVREKILGVLKALGAFAEQYKALPCLGFTHFQPAQLTTVGKRACLWMQDLWMDLEELDALAGSLRLLGSKGTTGTQASFKELFAGDYEKVKELDRRVALAFGFPGVYPVSGQTYSRKVDARVLNLLSGVAQSASKFAQDLRLLQHLKEIEEPFEGAQVGSSAMAYKRNPMRCERMTALCRFVMVDALNPALTAGAQWLERTLDDSANKRLSIPEGFLAVDGILTLYANVAEGLTVYPQVIARHIREELPFMATENILMAAVKQGGDRQALHEKIRVHAMAAARRVKEEGKENDLLERLAADFPLKSLDLTPENFCGFAREQTEEFLAAVRVLWKDAELRKEDVRI
jgi:adenylosuccinate lyase